MNFKGYMMKKAAFTMIELVFVIVVLGILAAIAIPKFSVTRTDATISKGRSDIAAIRSAIINERQSRIIKGDSSWIAKLEPDNSTDLFSNVLMYSQKDGQTNGKWHKRDNSGGYAFYINSTECDFTYDNQTGKFTLDANQPSVCEELIK